MTQKRSLTITAKSVILAAVLIAVHSCSHGPKSPVNDLAGKKDTDLIIFHAGSLSAPFKKISQDFEAIHPDINVLLEAAGSVDCARKITELKKPCDLMASSDYNVIENFLLPGYSSWHISFAANEMVIAYTEKSRQGEIISNVNWPTILLNEDVRYGRADPASDPCGYRTIMTLDLAEKYLGKPGLTQQFIFKDSRYIRPKEVDLLALLDVGEVDYIFIYRSVAIQHHLKYLELPDEINLKNPALAELYHQVSVRIPSGKPGDSLLVTGDPMVYSITLLDEAPNREAAMKFLHYLLDQDGGLKVMEAMGQKPVVPSPSKYYDRFPDELKQYVIPL